MLLRPAVALVATLAALAAGCGGDESASPEQEWAQSVCAPFAVWRGEMRELGDDLRDPADPLEALREAGERASAATDDLLDELDDAGAPPGEAEAAGVLEGLITSLRAAQETVLAQLEQLDAITPAQAGAALGLAAAQLSAVVGQVEATFASLRTTGDDLESGFAGADACAELEGG